MASHHLRNPQNFTGVADIYDRVRPRPPGELLDLLCQLSEEPAPTVIDVGAGTGHSTFHWAGRATRVVAVEPSADMRETLTGKIQREGRGVVEVLDGTAEVMAVPDDFAHVVTAGQAMHWFDPERAFAEIARVLRPGGVFAAYDPAWPPAVNAAVEAAYENFKQSSRRVQEALGVRPAYAARRLSPTEQLAASGAFRRVWEVCLRHEDTGNASRMMDAAYSIGGTKALVESGVPEDELGLTRLREVCEQEIPDERVWRWTYTVRLGTA